MTRGRRNSWLSNIRVIGEAFIAQHYPKEAPLFATFWKAYLFQVQRYGNQLPGHGLSKETVHEVTAEVSFATGESLDCVTPLTLATLSTVLHNLDKEEITSAKIEKLVHEAARRYGAKPGLSAVLVRHLPALCMEILTANPDADEGVVFTAPPVQYRIWMNGEQRIVGSMDDYKADKNRYLFWIDLDDDQREPPLTPRSIELLKYLVERLGIRIPVKEVMSAVFDDEMGDDPRIDKNKIDQQFSKLNKHCSGRFYEYRFGDWFTKGLGLKTSFADKYLLFERC